MSSAIRRRAWSSAVVATCSSGSARRRAGSWNHCLGRRCSSSSEPESSRTGSATSGRSIAWAIDQQCPALWRFRRSASQALPGRQSPAVPFVTMPLYKEQGIVLRSIKLGEADKIVTILTQGSGKIRAVAKGIRKTTSRFGGRLEPFTHVNLLLYQGRNLDTVTQAEILTAFRLVRSRFDLIAAGATMREA